MTHKPVKDVLPTGDTTLIVLEDDEEFLRCTQYVQMRELTDKKTKEEIAQFFDITVTRLSWWIAKWSKTGLLRRVRQELFAALTAEEIEVTKDSVARQWAAIMDRTVNTALKSKSDRVALEATQFLYEAFIKPRMDNVEMDSTPETDYILQMEARENNFNPLNITELEFTETDSMGE
jgi:hypothetical protein